MTSLAIGLGVPERRLSGVLDLLSNPLGESGSANFVDGIDAGWEVEPGTADPTYDGVTVSGGRCVFTFGAGDNIDAGVGTFPGYGAPRVRTDITGDFDITFRLAYSPHIGANQYAGYDIIVEGAERSLRFSLYARQDAPSAIDEVKYYIQAGGSSAVADGSLTKPTGLGNKGFPGFMRMVRSGTGFTLRTSRNGADWDTIYTLTNGLTVSGIGLAAWKIAGTGTADAITLGIDSAQFGTPVMPAVNRAPVRTPVFSPSLTDLTGLTNNSEGVGGSAAAAAGVLTLACGVANGSTGRVLTSSFAENQGVTGVVSATVSNALAFLGIGLRGTGGWAGQYAVAKSLVAEVSTADDLLRVLDVAGPLASNADGSVFTYCTQEDVTLLRIDLAARRFRFEVIGPVLRTKIWTDGDYEPEAWDDQIVNPMVHGAGAMGFALSHNDGNAVAATVEISDLVCYTIA